MSFQPPPDYTRVILAATVGVGLAVLAHIVTTDRTTHVGDNIHHLPHGGLYQDGNKKVLYGGPSRTNHSGSHWPAVAVVLLTLGIILSNRFGRRLHIHTCQSGHC